MSFSSDNEDIFEEDALISIGSNKLGSYGEEIFMMHNSKNISMIANSDKNEFIDRFSEYIEDKGKPVSI